MKSIIIISMFIFSCSDVSTVDSSSPISKKDNCKEAGQSYVEIDHPCILHTKVCQDQIIVHKIEINCPTDGGNTTYTFAANDGGLDISIN